MLVTVGLKAYNQRATLKAALEGVLAQTYRPLEIVVSDDGSTDGTWEEIQRIVGEHEFADDVRVVLNRNESNLGNMGNWLRICELSHGEWIVKCDGDDVSEPERTAEVVRAIEISDSPSTITVVSCAGTKIGADGRALGVFPPRSARYPLGACMAFRRDCYTKFPPRVDGRMMDDEVFARRALMLGSELLIDRPLVRYAVYGGSAPERTDIRKVELRCMRLLPAELRQSRVDLEFVRKDLGESRYQAWQRQLDYEESQNVANLGLRESPEFIVRWRHYRHLDKPSVFTPYRWKQLIYLLPRAFGDFLLSLLNSFRYH